MTRRVAIGCWAILIVLLAAGGVMLSATFGLLGYALATAGAERPAVFLFACSLTPMLVVGYLGRLIHERMQRRPVGGRLGQVEDALDRAAGSLQLARKTLHKHQGLLQAERREGLS